MKILVTGGCGFIGTNFILQELSRGENQILNLDKITYAGNVNNLATIEGHAHYQFVRGDICDIKAVSKVIEEFRPDSIINFAAESHVDRSIDNPMDFIQTNVLGTSVLLNISTKYWKRINNRSFTFIHVSTDEVFGSLGKDGLFSETSPYKPSSPYSASKASSDHLVRAWHKTYGLPSIITNCSNNYGPYQYPEKLIPLTITNCLDEKPLTVYGQGQNIRDWIYVTDHCNAMNRILKNGVKGETYNIGANNEIKNIDIVTMICEKLDKLKPRLNAKSYKKLITFVKDRPGHDYRYAIDISKIKSNLSWQAQESFDSGMEKTIKWYLNNEEWWRNIQNEKSNQ